MAGWDVTVAVPHGRDTAPLHILGVRTVARDTLVDTRPAIRALAVAGAVSAVGADAASVAPFEAFFSHGRPVRTDYADLLPVC
jgi:hypothetical protein